MLTRILPLVATGLVGLATAAAAAEAPVAVTPGDRSQTALIEGRCPTFGWGKVASAKSYELVVYRLGEESEEATPVLQETVVGSASSWTPSLEACLERGGRYGWSVRAVGRRGASQWSSPSFFTVVAGPGTADIVEAVAVIREYLGKQGDADLQHAPPPTAQSPVGPGTAPQRVGASAPSIVGPVADVAVLPVGDLDCRAGRYEDNGDGTVTDCRTGLIWLKAANCLGSSLGGFVTWAVAQALAADLTSLSGETCGLSDDSSKGYWRLPTKTEWMALVASARLQGFTIPALTDSRGTSKWTEGDAFIGVAPTLYWSATEGSDGGKAWAVGLGSGGVLEIDKTDFSKVWVVRELPSVAP
jgi:hypothetical protein